MVLNFPLLEAKHLAKMAEKDLLEIFRSVFGQKKHEIHENAASLEQIERMFVEHPLAFITLLNSTVCDPRNFWIFRCLLVQEINDRKGDG